MKSTMTLYARVDNLRRTLCPGWQAAAARLADVQPIWWILLGFLIPYIGFLIVAEFFSGPRMDVLQLVVPIMTPIGADLRQTMISVGRLFLAGSTPYVGNIPYPPLVYVLLGPLLLLEIGRAYIVFSVVTLVAYAWQVLVLPYRMTGTRTLSRSLLLVFVTGMMSYALLFELERAQFNVIAGLLAYLAIWVFHSNRKQRIWAYVLFCISVNLKVFPLVFIVMFVDDWRDWGTNMRRFVLLGLANLALGFVLGPKVFMDFVNALGARTGFPNTIRFDNHSAFSFARMAAGTLEKHSLYGLARAVSLIEYVIPIVIGLCMLLLIIMAYRRGTRGLDVPLLLVCALAAVLIPPVSHDYTLTLLAAPVALFLSHLEQQHADGRRTLLLAAGILVFAVAYGTMLIPLGYRPALLMLHSNFPELLTLLIVTMLFAWWWPPVRNAEGA
jgi:hypothetical protein